MRQNQTAIVGIGETAYSTHSGMSAVELLLQASKRAVSDAGLQMRDIDGVILPRRYSELTPYDFQFYTHADLKFSAYTGMEAGAGVINAIELAKMALAAGKANYILIYTGTNQASNSKKSSPRNIHAADPYKRNLEIPMGFFPQPVYFASMTQRYTQLYGDIQEQLAAIAVNSRQHAMLNENAQKKEPMTLQDYYESPIIADPLRLLDCCLVTDGAAAIIVTSLERARDLKKPAIPILGLATASLDHTSPYFFSQAPDPLVCSAVKTAPIAFSQAGISHDEIDVAEIYDSFTINVIIQLEDLGFCRKGEARDFIGNGERISLHGDLPVNTHGGLLSQGYIFGLNHVAEAVKQLRGEAGLAQVMGARTALVSGFGGWYQGTLILGSKS